jgi:hypothetical protein
MRRRRWQALATVIGCLALVGCTGQPQSVEVWGDVTFDGKPIPAGRIYFNPDFTKKNDGPQGYAVIHDGKFDTRKGGGSVCGGPTVVVIQGFDGSKDAGSATMGNALFKEFQIAVDLPRESGKWDFQVPGYAVKDVPKSRRGNRKP